MLWIACSIMVLATALSSASYAQSSEQPPAPAPEPKSADDNGPPSIVVIADRAIVASLQDVPVERTYDEDDIASYAASTAGEVLEQLRDENGDNDPAILVNGQPVNDPADIADLPAEAIARVEALPRGSAQRVGGAAGQRAYNVILRSSLASATVTGSYEAATEGGWDNIRGEVLLAYIKGRDRINLALRGADAGSLRESERPLTPSDQAVPFSFVGNVIPAFGGEVDPVLSALVGQTVSVVALPQGNSHLTIADLAKGANRVNPSEQAAFRTLRAANRPYEVAIAGSKTLTPWLSLSVNGRVSWSKSNSLSGLPSTRFVIPTSNPFSPFSVPVNLALNDPSRPLRASSDNKAQSLSATFNGNFGTWITTLNGRWDRREQTFTSQFTGSLPGGTLVPTANPFDGSLVALIPVNTSESHSTNSTTRIDADAEGDLVQLWAGPLRARVGVELAWIDYASSDSTGSRSLRRHEYSAKGGLTLPLTTAGDARFLPLLGESEIAVDFGRVDLGRFGSLDSHSLAFNWQPAKWLRLVAGEARDEQARPAELLVSPRVVTPNVPYFDPLTGDTVDVTLISGGAGSLLNVDRRTRNLSVSATPSSKYKLHLDVDYRRSDVRNQLGALPPPSAAVVAAFPDRFIRDATGALSLVDMRSVNFARQYSDQVRLGLGFTIPFGGGQQTTTSIGRSSASDTRTFRLQVNASETIVLHSNLLIRQGLGRIDLLSGGAIGVGGASQKYAADFNIALTRGQSGLRLSTRRRGAAYLVTGTPSAPQFLTFHPLATVDLKAFMELHEFLPHSQLAKGTRLTVAFDNLTNKRQRVTDLVGATPGAYQPIRRDPIGRIVKLELRKVF